MNKRGVLAVTGLLLFTFWVSGMMAAQDEDAKTPQQPVVSLQPSLPQGPIVKHEGTVITPPSSVARPEDTGLRAHTNYHIFVPAGKTLATINPNNTYAEYPASMACVYKVGPQYAGCVPTNNSAYNATGGWGAIALVDAYDDPNAASDLAYFSSFFGLPAANFTRVIANSSFGTLNGFTASCSGTPANANLYGWDLEEALDMEWAHAMAPKAKIFLVEACSNSYTDLLYAEQVAGIQVYNAGGGDISNSWSSGEFSGEVGSYDDVFHRYYWKNVTYFASAGDAGWGSQYPSSSPWVISAGGTTVNRDASQNFLNESCWGGSGGGVSTYELWQSPPNISNGMGPWTSYQYPFLGQGARQTPDISFNADPASGVWVYDTDSGGGWYVVGGTSVSSPALAGIVNSTGSKLGQAPPGGGYYSTLELNLLYAQLFFPNAYKADFYDVTTGSNGSGHNAGVGYDQCTGIGSPRGKTGK